METSLILILCIVVLIVILFVLQRNIRKLQKDLVLMIVEDEAINTAFQEGLRNQAKKEKKEKRKEQYKTISSKLKKQESFTRGEEKMLFRFAKEHITLLETNNES